LVSALAYHDHNWGHFRWGADLSWDWGYVHPLDPGCPWTLVFLRISDGLRHRALSQVALLWHHGEHVRTFQDHELSFELTGVHGGARPLTLPRVMNLLVPGSASGVPALLALHAHGRDAQGDRLELRFETVAHSRIAVPSDSDAFGVMLLNETVGRAHVRGQTHLGAFEFAGTAVVEFVRG
jgi:hypothetical protein